MVKLFLIALLFGGPSFAADETKPHPHKGKSEKFTRPTPTKLTRAELSTIKQGQAVRRQIQNDSGGRGIAIMDIKASPEKIWQTILDFKTYPNWIDKLDKTTIYGGTPQTGQKVKFELSVLGMDVVYFIQHSYHGDDGYMTWTLDYSRESDLDDSTGYWMVYPSPDNPGSTRVEYTVDMRLQGWVPGFVENMLAKKGLTMATSWVKKQSE